MKEIWIRIIVVRSRRLSQLRECDEVVKCEVFLVKKIKKLKNT